MNIVPSTEEMNVKAAWFYLVFLVWSAELNQVELVPQDDQL